ncbi:MAG TPA: hypothetical protein DCX53_07575, partial [Anaerolineae bacterium]|nr:hypothetical protein [Anaerolineae bacterium]
MFLDLSGFSTMTDTLMQHGQHGAEVLASLMHGVFSPLVESIFEYGGKIVSFAGDGIMALYPVEGDEKSTALHALASAWVIQQRLLENPDRRTIYGKFTFSAKIGLTIGFVTWKILRSNDGESATYYFRGSAVDDSARAEHQASAGEIILSQRMKDYLRDDVRTRPVGAFYRFIRFRVAMPQKTTNEFPPVDLNVSKVFMPKDVIMDGVRGEFRQIANLFLRIPYLTDDDLKNFVNVIFELRKKYGGLVTRLDFGDKGCNMLLLWGAPIAYENDIGRTLNFVLDLQDKMDFPITAGVTYYIAHAGYLGSEMCEEYTCYGWGVNLASRFMMNAPDGEIWVDDRVARRVSQRFAIDYLGSQRFKGFAAEQKVHVLRHRKMELDVIYQGEMIGREDELNRMEKFVEPLWQGEFAGVLTVSGDAGIGKGRLVHEFASSGLFNLKNVYWANFKADQILRQSFNPLRGWLFRYFSSLPGQEADERKSAFNSKLDHLIASTSDVELASEIDRTRSFLGALINLHWDGSLHEMLDAEARYNNTIHSVTALIKAESLRQPVIFFLDDIQFVDQDTLAFLSQFKRSLQTDKRPHPIAIILTFRKQGESLPIVDELSDELISLGGISERGMAKLVENILGGPASPELMKLVAFRSEGNPYFAGQVIRFLQDENVLQYDNEMGWSRVDRSRDTVLPSDIRALLVARLDNLPRAVKSAVHTASVLGREFNPNVLSQMLGSESPTSELIAAAVRDSIWSRIDENRYIFHHGLLRDAAYSMQMRARRQELHVLALNALETFYKHESERYYAELAYHAEQGEIRSKAQHYYSMAAKTSASLFQNMESVEYFTKALAFTRFDDLEAQFDLLVERVALYSRLAMREQQLSDMDTLEQWAGQLKDEDRLMKVMMLRSSYHYFASNYQESINFAKQAEACSEALSNTDLALYTKIIWATALLRLGYMDEAMKRCKSTLEHVRMLRNRVEESRILNIMGLIALEQKEPSPAKRYFSESLEIAREVKNLDIEAKALNNLANAESTLNGNFPLARRYYELSYKLSLEIGDHKQTSSILGNLGYVAGMLGDINGARSYQEQSLQMSREFGNLYQELYSLINLSALEGIVNSAESARQTAQMAVELAQKVSDRTAQAWAMLYLGHAHLLRNESKSARDAYNES